MSEMKYVFSPRRKNVELQFYAMLSQIEMTLKTGRATEVGVAVVLSRCRLTLLALEVLAAQPELRKVC